MNLRKYLLNKLRIIDFFPIWAFFYEHLRFKEQQGKEEAISFTPLYQFHLLHKRLEICRTITAEVSSLHIAAGLEPESLHEKALRLTYQNRNLSFDELLKLDKSVSIQYRNLQYLLTEIYKVKMGLSPPIMNDILTLDENASYNLRSGVTVTRRNIRTNKFGFETISTIGAVLWRNLPNDIKNPEKYL